jgi:hypothetical protein
MYSASEELKHFKNDRSSPNMNNFPNYDGAGSKTLEWTGAFRRDVNSDAYSSFALNHAAMTVTNAGRGGDASKSGLDKMRAAMQLLSGVCAAGAEDSTTMTRTRIASIAADAADAADAAAPSSPIYRHGAAQEMQEIEITLRSISHDFMNLFVESQAQLYLLANSHQRILDLQAQLTCAEQEIQELSEDNTGAKGIIASLREEVSKASIVGVPHRTPCTLAAHSQPRSACCSPVAALLHALLQLLHTCSASLRPYPNSHICELWYGCKDDHESYTPTVSPVTSIT